VLVRNAGKNHRYNCDTEAFLSKLFLKVSAAPQNQLHLQNALAEKDAENFAMVGCDVTTAKS